MKVYLKIKVMSLAAEARIIRKEEKTWPGPSPQRHGLHFHRVHDVRDEARVAHLAYGFLRGRKYKQIEPYARRDANWRRVSTLVDKYGPLGASKALEAWRTTA